MRLIIIAALFILSTQITPGQEKIVLTNPPPSVSEYRIAELLLNWGVGESCVLSIRLIPNVAGHQDIQHAYRGAAACTMLRQLNKADLSTISLHRRIMNQLIADKVFVGLATGTPE